MTTAPEIHDLAGHFPYLHLASHVDVPTYFIVTSIAFVIALFFLLRRANDRDLPRRIAIDSALALMVGGFIGARLFHVFFEEPTYYAAVPSRVLEFWRGGFVWYGGLFGGTLGALAVFKIKQVSIPMWLDLYAPVAALGYGLGRVACLLTGCCYGEVCELANHELWRHPTQAYAFLSEFVTLAILLRIEKRRREPNLSAWLKPPGQVFAVWVVLHALGRIVMESFRSDPRGPLVFGVSVATALSCAAISAGAIVFVLRGKPQSNRK